MNTKRILISMVAGAMLTGSVAMAAHGNDQARSKTKVRAAKSTATATMTTGGNRSAVRTRQIATAGNTAVRAGNFSNRTRIVSGSRTRYSYPSRSYNYGYRSYGYGYPYYSYGPSVSFGFGYPYSYGYGYPYYSFGYYPYDYYNGDYPYTSGYYYGRPGYSTYANGSVVIQVQSRLARAGYYHGPIDGVMGRGTSFAIRAYERDHGLRMDGVISRQLMRNMGLRY